MIRRALAVVAGFVLFSLITFAGEAVSGKLFPIPESAMSDAAELQHALSGLPVAAFVFVLVNWAVASFAGGYLATRISREPRTAIILGVIVTAVGIMNNLMVPPPLWFWPLTLLVFVPPAYAASRLA